MSKVRTETILDLQATRFIIATGLFKEDEFAMESRKNGCYAPLRNPASDVRISMKQLMNTDPENAYPILMDYIRMVVASLLVGQRPARVNDICFNFEKKMCPNVFTAFPKIVEFEIYDAAEVLDDLTLYSAQLGVEYLRLISILIDNLDSFIDDFDATWDFKHKVWHNFYMLKSYARRLILSRWYRVYLENSLPNPAYTRIREDCFQYINSLSADDFIKEYPDIKKCISEHPDYFFDNKCL